MDNLVKGDGKAACSFLTDDEQALFVKNGADFPFVDNASCTTVVKSFHAAVGANLKSLRGSFEGSIGASEKAGSGNWIYADGGGQQRARLVKVDGRWFLNTDRNDFPTAVLHNFD